MFVGLTMSAQDEIYLMRTSGIIGVPTPGEEDTALVLNSETGYYEGIINISSAAGFKFYSGDAEDYTVIGPGYAYANISFAQSDVYEDTCEWDGTGIWYVSYFPEGEKKGDIEMKVNPNDGVVVFTSKVVIDTSFPENAYLWGSENWGMNYKQMAIFEPDTEHPNLLVATLDVPEVGPYDGDPEFAPGEDDPEGGFYFIIGGENWVKQRYMAPFDEKVIDLSGDETYDVTMIRNYGASFICVSHGLMVFTIDPETLQLTVTYAPEEGDNSVEGLEIDPLNSGEIYNLHGIRVSADSLQKGIYIQNGKKYVVK